MKKINMDFFVRKSEFFTLLIIVCYFLIISIINPSFFSLDTIMRILYNGTMLFIVSLGVSIVMITKNIDVSVGSLMGLAATLGGAVINSTHSIPLLILVTVGTGFFGGLFNGIGVAYLGVTSIIMTLGTMAVFRGLLIMYTGGQWIQTIPEFYMNFSKLEILGINAPIWIFLILVLGLWFMFSKTRLGRYFYAAGNNYEGAIMQGISVKPITVLAFVFAGVLSGIASLIYVSQIGAVPNMAGMGLETQAIAAAVIGGVSLNGGKGNQIGAALGAILLQTINYSLVYLKVPGYWNNAISGFMLLSIIIFSSLVQKHLKKNKERLLEENIRKEYLNSMTGEVTQ